MRRLLVLLLFAAQAVLPPALCLCRLEAMVLPGQKVPCPADHEHEEDADHQDHEDHEESCACERTATDAVRSVAAEVPHDDGAEFLPRFFTTAVPAGPTTSIEDPGCFRPLDRPLYLTLRAFLI